MEGGKFPHIIDSEINECVIAASVTWKRVADSFIGGDKKDVYMWANAIVIWMKFYAGKQPVVCSPYT